MNNSTPHPRHSVDALPDREPFTTMVRAGMGALRQGLATAKARGRTLGEMVGTLVLAQRAGEAPGEMACEFGMQSRPQVIGAFRAYHSGAVPPGASRPTEAVRAMLPDVIRKVRLPSAPGLLRVVFITPEAAVVVDLDLNLPPVSCPSTLHVV